MKTIVIYHKADFDGIFCREIARKRFGESAEYIGWDYGDPVPAIGENDFLYLLDISVHGLMSHPNLIWIDHHKTAIELFGEKMGLQADGVAACRLAWQYFFGDADSSTGVTTEKNWYVNRQCREPLAVRLAGEWDVWDKRDERCESLQYGLKSVELNKGRWNMLLDTGALGKNEVSNLCQLGKVVSDYQKGVNVELIKTAFSVEWEGLRLLCVNSVLGNSGMFESVIGSAGGDVNNRGYDGLLKFYWNHARKAWSVSLYSVFAREDVDLSVVAVKYGGGGHRGACGFSLSDYEMKEILGDRDRVVN